MKETALIIHFIGLILGIGSGFAQMFLGIASSKLSDQEKNTSTILSNGLGKMSNVGLILLVLSGGYMMTPYWGELSSLPLLITKLLLVVILIILVIIMNIYGKKLLESRDEKAIRILKLLGKISLPLGLLIIILAVLVFN